MHALHLWQTNEIVLPVTGLEELWSWPPIVIPVVEHTLSRLRCIDEIWSNDDSSDGGECVGDEPLLDPGNVNSPAGVRGIDLVAVGPS